MGRKVIRELLTAPDREAIARRFLAGETSVSVARSFGVAPSYVRALARVDALSAALQAHKAKLVTAAEENIEPEPAPDPQPQPAP